MFLPCFFINKLKSSHVSWIQWDVLVRLFYNSLIAFYRRLPVPGLISVYSLTLSNEHGALKCARSSRVILQFNTSKQTQASHPYKLSRSPIAYPSAIDPWDVKHRLLEGFRVYCWIGVYVCIWSGASTHLLCPANTWFCFYGVVKISSAGGAGQM